MKQLSAFDYGERMKKVHSPITGKEYSITTRLAYTNYMTKHIDNRLFDGSKEEIVERVNKEVYTAKNPVLRSAFMNYLLLCSESIQEEEYFKKHVERPPKRKKTAMTDKSKMDMNLEAAKEMERVIEETSDWFVQTMMRTLFDLGCRRSELMTIKLKDLTPVKDMPNVGASIELLGKGNKRRTAYITKNTLKHILKLGRERRIGKDDYLFRFPNTVQTVQAQTRLLYHHINKWGKQIVGDEFKLSPHKFRHACALRMSKAGIDVKAIRDYLGHSDMGTTAIYMSYAEDKNDETAERYFMGRKK